MFFLSQIGIFGCNVRRHCILDALMAGSPTESARGSAQTCRILDLLSEGFFFFFKSRVYWAYCAHFWHGVTESARWDNLFICHVFCFFSSFFLSLPPFRQMALTQVSHQQSPLIWLTSPCHSEGINWNKPAVWWLRCLRITQRLLSSSCLYLQSIHVH